MSGKCTRCGGDHRATDCAVTGEGLEVIDLGKRLGACSESWDRLKAERDALAEQVRSLTVERDRETKRADLATSHLREVCAENSEAVGRLADALQERDDTQAERDALRARLSRAREALDRYDEEPPHYRAGLDEENAWRARQEAALADLRSALTEEAPHGQV